MKAAVCNEFGKPLEIEDVEIVASSLLSWLPVAAAISASLDVLTFARTDLLTEVMFA